MIMGLSVVLVEDVGGNVGGVVGENHFGEWGSEKLRIG